jgi:hypothetical protein
MPVKLYTLVDRVTNTGGVSSRQFLVLCEVGPGYRPVRRVG